MSDETSPKSTAPIPSAGKSENANISREAMASKVHPLDEDFEHTLRRAAREKEKQRAKNLSLYR